MRKLVFAPILIGVMLLSLPSFAQGDAKAGARLDVRQITIGDQARLFLEVQNSSSTARVQWAVIPDSFNKLEVVEKGKIDTFKQGGTITYRQRLLITGWDSGLYKVPSFSFSVIPGTGAPYTIQSDSFMLMVNTVAVDTTKGFKGIKGIIYVKNTWLDYIWVIIGAVVFIVLMIFVILYFVRNRRAKPAVAQGPTETLQEFTLRLLNALDGRQLWQKKQVKEYYIELTDIIRNYIEARFETSAMELTTDEILAKALEHKEMVKYYDILSEILHTADLAKFAKFQPLPQEHIDAMQKSKQFVATSVPVVAPMAAPGNNTDTDNNTGKSNPTA